MERGNARTRRTTYARQDELAVSWKLSATQMAAFRAWFDHRDGADGGNAWFYTSILTGDSSSVQSKEVKFKGAWKAEMSGPFDWIVSATLEVRPSPSLATGWDFYEQLELATLDLDFANQSYSYFDGSLTQIVANPFGDLISFSRASIGWYYDVNGITQTAAINEPRIDYDLSTHECLGLKIQSDESPETEAPDRVAILNHSNWLRSDEGTFIVDAVEKTVFDGTARNFITAISSAGGENVMVFRRGPEDSAGMSVTNDSVQQCWLETGDITINGRLSMAAAYKTDDFYGTVNGGSGASALTGAVPSSLDRLYIGAGASYLNGCINVRIKRIRFFPFRMTNARMQELTSA